jgi:hypothetical protein
MIIITVRNCYWQGKHQLLSFTCRPVCLAYQPPANSTFLSEQTNHHQTASSTFLSEQTITSQTNRPVILTLIF